MITERHEELAALHVLGLLDGAERTAFEAEIAANPELASLVDSLAATTAGLALAAPQSPAPAGLKDRIMAALPPAAAIPVPLARLIPWGLAAALAVAAAGLALRNFSLQADNEGLRTERRLAEIAYQSARNQLTERSLLAEKMINTLGDQLRKSENLARLKVSALASLAGDTKEARAIAVWDPDQQAGLLTLDKLPPIEDWQDYQLWVVDPAHPNPVNGGVFHVGKDGRAALAFWPDKPVNQAAAFAISLEKKGGVAKAEGPIVLLGKLPGI